MLAFAKMVINANVQNLRRHVSEQRLKFEPPVADLQSDDETTDEGTCMIRIGIRLCRRASTSP